jgi:hypothetical protein
MLLHYCWQLALTKSPPATKQPPAPAPGLGPGADSVALHPQKPPKTPMEMEKLHAKVTHLQIAYLTQKQPFPSPPLYFHYAHLHVHPTPPPLPLNVWCLPSSLLPTQDSQLSPASTASSLTLAAPLLSRNSTLSPHPSPPPSPPRTPHMLSKCTGPQALLSIFPSTRTVMFTYSPTQKPDRMQQ